MPKPPIAKKIPTSVTHHGHTLYDDYAWLRQDNWQEMFRDTSLLRDDIRAYLEAENAHTKANLTDPQQSLIDQLIEEMKARMEINYDTAPITNRNYHYFTRYSEADYPLYLRRDESGAEEVILDVTKELSKDGRKVFLDTVVHSSDNSKLMIVVNFSGSEESQILIKDLKTGQYLPDDIQKVGEASWAPDSQSIFYTKFSDNPEQFRQNRVFQHVIGQTQADDQLLFQDDDTEMFLSCSVTPSKDYLVISLNNSKSSEHHIKKLNDPNSDLICIVNRQENILSKIAHADEYFYFCTNKDQAINFKVMRADIKSPQIVNWKEFIPHDPETYIQTIVGFQDHVVLLQLSKALPAIQIRHLSTGEKHEIAFDEQAYDLNISYHEGYYTPSLRYSYSSPRTPAQIFNYNMQTKQRVLVRQANIQPHIKENYILERVLVPSHDGIDVPMTIIRHKDTPIDGTAPTRLYAYGSYGMNVPTSYERYNLIYPLIDRGMICAQAHIRGGADCGYQWYLDGKLDNKKNTFFDFIECGKWLVDKKYTNFGLICGEGRSAGGLLIGAVSNMAPEGLFGAMIADVPFVDLMNTILDETLPLTPPEWNEWGNPITEKSAFNYMLSYSPYDNVERKNYPAMFISGGLTDPRVTYWEPAKWAAKLRDFKTDNNPLYLTIEMDSGHFGDPGRFSGLKERAREYVFMMQALGIK